MAFVQIQGNCEEYPQIINVCVVLILKWYFKIMAIGTHNTTREWSRNLYIYVCEIQTWNECLDASKEDEKHGKYGAVVSLLNVGNRGMEQVVGGLTFISGLQEHIQSFPVCNVMTFVGYQLWEFRRLLTERDREMGFGMSR